MRELNFSVVRFDRNDTANAYLAEVRKYKTLTDTEIREQLRKGNIEKVVNSNLRLVVSCAMQYQWAMPLMDCIQEGNIGLLNACSSFDTESTCGFASFAGVAIRMAIFEAIEKNGRLVRRPHHEQKTGCIGHSSLNDEVDGEDGSIEWVDLLIGDNGDWHEKEEVAAKLTALMSRLSEREQKILTLYYGLGTDIPMGYPTIALEIGCSEERVRQLHLQAIAKMRG